MSYSPDLDDLRYEREDRREAERDAWKNAYAEAAAEEERLDAEWNAKYPPGVYRPFSSRKKEEAATRLAQIKVQRKEARDAMSLMQRIEMIEEFCENVSRFLAMQNGCCSEFHGSKFDVTRSL